MSNKLPIGQLTHYFNKNNPTKSKALQETMINFHMRELEASDYRSAYHQFSDWLYGWSVSDGREFNLNEAPTRNPRGINMNLEKEQQDAKRLMATFETLTSITLRHLKVCYSTIDNDFPFVGRGLDTFLNSNNVEVDLNEDLTETTANTIEKVWGDKDKIEEKVVDKIEASELVLLF
jgi:hypothetical protein